VFLSGTAGKVHMLVRSKALSETTVALSDRAHRRKSAVEVHYQTEITSLDGNDHLESITCRTRLAAKSQAIPSATYSSWREPHRARTGLQGCLALDDKGFILTGRDLDTAVNDRHWTLARPPQMLETSLPGVFAVGDVRSGSGEARGLGGWRRGHRDSTRAPRPGRILKQPAAPAELDGPVAPALYRESFNKRIEPWHPFPDDVEEEVMAVTCLKGRWTNAAIAAAVLAAGSFGVALAQRARLAAMVTPPGRSRTSASIPPLGRARWGRPEYKSDGWRRQFRFRRADRRTGQSVRPTSTAPMAIS